MRADVQLLDPNSRIFETVLGWHWREWSDGHQAPDLEVWRAGLRQRCSGHTIPFTLVALVDGEPVGCVSVRHDDADARCSDRGPWLSGVLVISRARNLGVGRAMLAAAADRARELGAAELWLHTREATRFYQRCGYQLAHAKHRLDDQAVLWTEL